jgi:hypothetical protein
MLIDSPIVSLHPTRKSVTLSSHSNSNFCSFQKLPRNASNLKKKANVLSKSPLWVKVLFKIWSRPSKKYDYERQRNERMIEAYLFVFENV